MRPKSAPEKASIASTNVTIIVVARNEADHLGALLSDLLGQTALSADDEIIVINDHSTDGTAKIVAATKDPRLRLIELEDHIKESEVVAHKKAAITIGVKLAAHSWIVLTDADCRWPAEVLHNIKEEIAGEDTQMICGPVLIRKADSALTGFQSLDLLAYVFLTAAYTLAGRPILANGAHLSFRKDLFQQIDGYAGIDHLPSGDDVLLLQKVLREVAGARISYLKVPAATVYTEPMNDWPGFWRQRLRWAAKTGQYQSPDLDLAQRLSFLVALMLVGSLFAAIFRPEVIIAVLIWWLTKSVLEWIILRRLAHFYGQERSFRFYPFAALLQPFYLVIVGTATLLAIKVSWKGRRSQF